MSSAEDREELARLAGALGARVRRRARLGQRRSAQPGAQAAAPAEASRPQSPTASTAPAGSRSASRTELLAARAAVHAVAARAADDSPAAQDIEDVRRQASACGDLAELRAAVARCRACSLCQTRTQTVFMDGGGARGVMFVGEAPGADEDRTGVPFVGRAGQLLTDIIEKGMGLARDEVHIVNVLKCRPPENRDPTQAEKETCTPWLERQIELCDPRVIIPLGKHAAAFILRAPPGTSMGAMRGKVLRVGERKVVPTYHPAYLLRSPGEKKECWKDIQLAMTELGIARPSGGMN